jgi:nitrogen fixation protein FixH
MKNKSNWGIGIFVVYGIFVLCTIGFALFASSQKFDLVTDDYYGEQIKHQQHIEKEKRTNALSTSLKTTFYPKSKTVQLLFPPEMNFENLSGHILFFRPSDAAQDKVVPLSLDSSGKQHINVSHLSKGNWRIKIFWAFGTIDYYNESDFHIK